jgi:hypothetical protein
MTDVPVRYYGFFYVSCTKFVVIGSYPNVNPSVYGKDIDPGGVLWGCSHCGQNSFYSRSDIAHSDWRDGTEPHYPQRC